MSFNIFPWDNSKKPYWVNPENKLEWYIDEYLTEYCTKNNINDSPKLDAMVFYVCERKKDKLEPISRVLIDKKTNKVLSDETSLEAMAIKIDVLRFVL